MSKKNPVGIYIHIPFCATKCPYCVFYSEKYSGKLAEQYVDKIVSDMTKYSGVKADALYFGGGTPSLLKPELIAYIIDTATKNFSLSGEVTLEANPNTLNESRLRDYKQAGVNRLSMGMQSANSSELSALGRTHSVAQLENAVNTAVKCGISNLSVDLMLGTPYQTLQSLNDTLTFVKTLPIKHLSAYMLKVEKNTPYNTSELLKYCADDDLMCELYKNTVTTLTEHGLIQYEISNFAVLGYESKHNLKYWQCNDYLGFGASAHSCFKGERFSYKNDISAYLNGDERIIDAGKPYDINEYVMLGLRLVDGISIKTLTSHYNADTTKLIKRLDLLKQKGLINYDNYTVALTVDGFLLSNTIISDLLSKLI